MERSLERARSAVRSASDLTDDATVHDQLDSIDDGLATLTGDEAPDDEVAEGERLESIERELAQLGDAVDGPVADRLETARDHNDAFRREHAQDWQ